MTMPLSEGKPHKWAKGPEDNPLELVKVDSLSQPGTALGVEALRGALGRVMSRHNELGAQFDEAEQETPPHTPEITSAELPPHSLAAAAIRRAIEVHGSEGDAFGPILVILREHYPGFFPEQS